MYLFDPIFPIPTPIPIEPTGLLPISIDTLGIATWSIQTWRAIVQMVENQGSYWGLVLALTVMNLIWRIIKNRIHPGGSFELYIPSADEQRETMRQTMLEALDEGLSAPEALARAREQARSQMTVPDWVGEWEL